jgi:two-component system sensor histidine kinase KdpD
VLDRGYGVPAEDLERIFDKFYRVQRPQGISGTGLGLAICQGIVEAHRGRIWAQNRSGGGTIVTVALPCEPTIQTDLAEDASLVSTGPAVETEDNGSVQR